jgi:hypothetical protein
MRRIDNILNKIWSDYYCIVALIKHIFTIMNIYRKY